MSGPTPCIVHPPRFQVAAASARMVVGVALDKDTGRPIAGLEIRAGVYAGPYFMFQVEGVEARTDDQGHNLFVATDFDPKVE